MKGKGFPLESDEHIASFAGTLPQLLAAQAARFGAAQTAIRDKAYGIWQTYHWEDYLRYVKHVGLGLIALGFRRGESAGLITDNHPEWLFCRVRDAGCRRNYTEPLHVGRRR